MLQGTPPQASSACGAVVASWSPLLLLGHWYYSIAALLLVTNTTPYTKLLPDGQASRKLMTLDGIAVRATQDKTM